MGLRDRQGRPHGLCRQLSGQQRAGRRSGEPRSSPARSRSAGRPSRRSPAKAKRSSTTPAAASTSGTAATPATTKAAPTASPPTRPTTASPFTFKTVLPLHHLPETGPWTWHGWQTDLRAAMQEVAHRDDARPPADRATTSMPCWPTSQSLNSPPNPFRSKDGSLTARSRARQADLRKRQGRLRHLPQRPALHRRPDPRRRPRLAARSLQGLQHAVAPQRLSTGEAAARRPRRFAAKPCSPARTPRRKSPANRQLKEDEVKDLVEYLKTL